MKRTVIQTIDWCHHFYQSVGWDTNAFARLSIDLTLRPVQLVGLAKGILDVQEAHRQPKAEGQLKE
jgi:hypothetical protein